MAGSQAAIEIRQLFQLEEFEQVLALQKSIWSFADIELLPLRFLVVVSKVGGHLFGAYDGGRMIGFCFAIPGIKEGGRPYLHSHMMGVLEEYHNAGVGRRLKLRQREDALGRGMRLIEWTFDPLELKNAFFNLERLGAVIRRYVENQYGTSSSPLQSGLPTDRCIAEWWIGKIQAKPPVAARVALPSQKTVESQEALRSELQRHFADGLAVTGFERHGDTGTYLLSVWDSK